MAQVSLKSSESLTVAQVSEFVGGGVVRGESVLISGTASLERASGGDIAFAQEEKFFVIAARSNASCLLIPDSSNSWDKVRAEALIKVPNPRLAMARIGEILHPPRRREPFVHPTAVISSSAVLDSNVFIGPHVYIGEASSVAAETRIEANVVIGDRVTIGQGCVLHPGVVLYDEISVGNGVILHAGVCIGADGFGYERGDGGHHKLPQIGTVVIEDNVELGSYTCVDRGAFGETRIGKGAKLDNLVHVGHNCDIGERVVIAAQTGISGSVVIEDDAVIGGQVGFGDHAHVEKGVVIGSKAGVLPHKTVRALPKVDGREQDIYWGIPIRSLREFSKLNAIYGRLPEMRKEIAELQNRLDRLERTNHDI